MAGAPDIDDVTPDIDVDEKGDGFRRGVAVIVALIAFFAVTVAYLQAVESNDEDRAARDAQRASVDSFGSEVGASAQTRADLGLATEIELQRERQAINAGRVQFDNADDIHQAASERFAAVQEALRPFTPVDPADGATANEALAAAAQAPDAAGLLQEVLADRADDHGGKADSYVAVLTVLAVGLFLIGLSLTVQGRTRWVLAGPGIAVALVCVVATGLIARRPITVVSENATRLAAEGQRAANAGRFEEAFDAYDAAIADSPDFAAAYSRRADVHFRAGLLQSGQTQFPSITSEDARNAAIEDLDRALDLGADRDFATVAEAGFFAFLDRDFERSAELSAQAVELNDRQAQVHFNLGVAQVALDDENAARRAYVDGIEVLRALPDKSVIPAILAGARTDLSLLRDLLNSVELENRLPLIETQEARLAEFEAGLLCAEQECSDPVDGDVELGDVEFTSRAGFVFANVPVEGMDPGETFGAAWYFRTDPELPFEQAAFAPFEVRTVRDDGVLETSALPSEFPPCPLGGEYLVRLYSGDRFLGEVTGEVPPSPIGASFTTDADPLAGLEVCVPDGFTSEVVEDDTLGSVTTFVRGDLQIFPTTVRGVVPPGTDPEEAARIFIEGALSDDDVELEPATLLGRTLIARSFVDLAGFQAVSPTGIIAAAVDEQGTVRVVFLGGTDDRALMTEVLGLVQFTGLPETP
ncbi:MAG: hypothetical protein H0W25_21560 [Acidimicrobiia bacterium]|nr:hypothetical protein [Acidimicrobiia bacterium]